MAFTINNYPILIKVFNEKNEPLLDVRFYIRYDVKAERTPLRAVFEPVIPGYHIVGPPEGDYILEVTHEGYEPVEQQVVFRPGKKLELVITLVRGGRPYYVQGSARVSYNPLPEERIYIRFSGELTPAQIKKLENKIRKLGLEEIKLPTAEPMLRQYRVVDPKSFRSRSLKENNTTIRAELKKEKGIIEVGEVLEQRGEKITRLLEEITVKFKDHVTEEQINSFLQEFNLEISRKFPAPNLYLLRSPSRTNAELLQICSDIQLHPFVETVSSNAENTREKDLINPPDYLAVEQWDHLNLINTPLAWDHLQNDPNRGAKGNTAFGNPNIVLSVCDVDGTDITHQDFAGNVSSGAAKITQVFNFLAKVANMNNPEGSHGTCCCSASVSQSNTTEGIAGVSGNTRLMPCKVGGGGPLDADMFQWVAGINPNSTIAGFPAALPAAPAHIISNSWGAPSSTIHAAVAAALDRITNYGRNGRGTLIFFSAGNTCMNGIPYERRRPYGTHTKAMAVAASSLDNTGSNEIRAQYSNFGSGIQFCAPSNDDCTNTHNPPANFGAFTATHRPNAPNPIGSTTIAAIISPTVVQLSSTAGFSGLVPIDVVIGALGTAAAERFARSGLLVGSNLTLDMAPAAAPAIGAPILVVDGNCPGSNALNDTLAAAGVAGSFTITVNTPALFTAGRAVMINPGTPTAEAHAIRRVNVVTNVVTLMTALNNPFPIGTRVDVGSADYKNNFGGTSYATPVTAGIAALCLAANNILSWIEVRHILRTTGHKINIGETGTVISGINVGKWRDINNQDVVTNAGALVPAVPAVASTLTSLNPARTIATVAPGADFQTGQAFVITGGGNTEFRVITGVAGNDITLDRQLVNGYPAASPVQAGLRPHYSGIYGFGRVNAARAVQAALDAQTNFRQLVIRHNLADNGTVATSDIQSPDIWVTNTPLTASGAVYTLKREVTGLDDFTFQQNFNGQQNAKFYIEINNTIGFVDQFTWSFNDTVVAAAVAIAGGAQVLTIGALSITISFAAVTGHKDGDNWTIFVDFIEAAMDYTKDAPHENPKVANDRFVHARIKNLVTGALTFPFNLDAWVRFYIVLASGKTANATAQGAGFTSNFFFSSNGNNNDWTDTNAIAGITGGAANTYFLGEVEIFEGLIPAADASYVSKNNYIVSVPWNTAQIPPAATTQSIYLLTHIAPFHGSFTGTGAHNNSCLSYREIAFADIKFRDQTGAVELVKKLNVDAFGTTTNQGFSIEVKFDIGNFTTEKTRLEVVRVNDNSTESKAVFMHNGAGWVFDAANPQWTGLTINAPVITGSTTPATAAQTTVTFQGAFDTAKEHQRVIFRPQVVSKHNTTSVIAIAEHVVDVIEQGEMPTGIDPASLAAPPPPKSYAFADMGLITQTANEAFGPISGQESNKFRVTNLFTATNDTFAYAITSGVCFLQPGPTADTVNLVLRPFKQTVISFTPVKYFVYRGLRKADFLDPGDNTKILPSDLSNSEFIKRQREIHVAQNPPGTDFLSKSMGYDPTNQPAADALDAYFFRNDPDFQLPFANKGMQLGHFNHAGGNVFGIDILLEEGYYKVDLANIRKASHEIDVTGMPTGTDAQKFAKKQKREEILNYLDIAPFYGLHMQHSGTVETRKLVDGTTENRTGQDIYTKVVSKFHNRNRIYLDVRNETGNSYNFFDNYKAGAGEPTPGANIKIGTEYTSTSVNNLVDQTYQTNDWPIIVEDRVQNVTGDKNQLIFALRFDNNQNPMLYVEQGITNSVVFMGTPPFFDSIDLGIFLMSAIWTKELGFDVPNTGASGTKSNVSNIIKVLYGLAVITPAPAWPDTVLKTEVPTDNVFGPLDLNPLWKSDKAIKWITAQDKKYIDLGGTWGYMADRGVSLDAFSDVDPNAGRVIFFGVASDYYKPPGGFQNIQGITGGVSSKGTFFEAASFLRGLKLVFDQLIITGTKITTLQLVPSGGGALTANSVLLLCISRKELEALKALPGFNTQYPRYVKIEQVAFTADDKGKMFKMYKLKVQGLDANGKYKLAAPATDIFVYSVDDYLHFSDEYSKDEPLPTTYTRDAEEFIGTQQNTAAAKSWEDFFIDLDTKAGLAGAPDKVQKIVTDFTTAVNAVVNDASAKANLQTHIDNFATAFLTRMRAFAVDGTNNNADDRILYWGRIKMKVALQSHEFVLQSFQDRNELLQRLEAKSRGYDTINFSAVPLGVRKILMVGFDPYFLDPKGGLTHNVRNSNPSGAAALALHGQNIMNGANPVAFVQSVILPVRFSDLDKNGGEGIVEELFTKFIDPAATGYTPVDQIVVLDRAVPRSFMFARFAARRRGSNKDNQFQHNALIPLIITGDQFYETTLAPEKAVPDAPYAAGLNYYRYFTQTYEYRIKAGGAIKKFTDQKRQGKTKINNNPDGGDVNNLLPTVQPQANIVALQGSFNFYFPNEVFYRLCVIRQKKNAPFKVGLLMLPRLQGTPAEAAADKKVKTDFNGALTKEVIDELKLILKDLVV